MWIREVTKNIFKQTLQFLFARYRATFSGFFIPPKTYSGMLRQIKTDPQRVSIGCGLTSTYKTQGIVMSHYSKYHKNVFAKLKTPVASLQF